MVGQPSKEQELVGEAYKVLVNLLCHDEVLFWRRNEILIALNGGLIIILGLVWPSGEPMPNPPPKILAYTLCVIGLVMCLLWLIIVKRGEAFYNHWYAQLTFLEKQYLSPVRIFQIAEEYFEKGHIKLGEEEFELDYVSKRMRIFHAMVAAPVVFLLAWAAILFYVCIAW